MQASLEMVKALLDPGKKVVVLTGAGVSAESGVPTFRGRDGLWKTYRAEDLARPDAFAARPELVWEFYNWRRELVGGCEPNAPHRALAVMERQIPNFLLITQNVPPLPECPVCGHLLRPGVVWFGEPLIPGVLKLSVEQLGHADLFISVGTSNLVQPAASFHQLAKDHGAVTVEINPEATPNTGLSDFALHGRAGDILPELIAGMTP
jgi:NAD-dependent deacetylase